MNTLAQTQLQLMNDLYWQRNVKNFAWFISPNSRRQQDNHWL
jgi:hypothetical protein